MQFDEDGVLSAFDLNRNLIYAIAAKVYGRGRKGSAPLLQQLVQRAAARSLSLETFGPHRMTATAQANGV